MLKEGTENFKTENAPTEEFFEEDFSSDEQEQYEEQREIPHEIFEQQYPRYPRQLSEIHEGMGTDRVLKEQFEQLLRENKEF